MREVMSWTGNEAHVIRWGDLGTSLCEGVLRSLRTDDEAGQMYLAVEDDGGLVEDVEWTEDISIAPGTRCPGHP